MGNANSQTTACPSVSSFYLACRSGDVDTVKQMLPTMRLKEINRIESNGSTALHVAAWYGHFEIVELLLKYGCSAATINQYGKNAAQECKDERIRQLIQAAAAAVLNNVEEINGHAPNSKWCQIYENIDNQDKSLLATKVMKLRLRTYLTNQFKTNGANRTDHIKNIVLHNIPTQHQQHARAVDLLKRFENTKNPEHLIMLYTMSGPFFLYIESNQDEVFYMELLIGLTVFQKRFFQGITYRGCILHQTDLDFYLWAWHHHASFIEIRTLCNTSASRSVAEIFADSPFDNDRISTLFIYHFIERCETAIDSRTMPHFPLEEEILIIPGTFFEVTSVKKSSSIDDSPGLTIIELKNIPVSREILLKTINELK